MLFQSILHRHLMVVVVGIDAGLHFVQNLKQKIRKFEGKWHSSNSPTKPLRSVLRTFHPTPLVCSSCSPTTNSAPLGLASIYSARRWSTTSSTRSEIAVQLSYTRCASISSGQRVRERLAGHCNA
jgi:hypothetical protein